MKSLATFRADSPVPLAERYTYGRGGTGLFASPETRGYVRQMAMFGEIGTVQAIVSRLMSSVSKVEWKLWTKTASGLDEDRVEIKPGMHAALDLWNRPNPFMTQAHFIKAITQHKELTGEANAVVGYAGKIPLELWPVRPDRLEPMPDPFKFLTGWSYTGPNGDRVPLELNEIIRSILPSPLDPYRGMGPVRSIIKDLETEDDRRTWQRMFFKNSARPGGIVQVDKRLSDPEFDEMRERWAEQHKGVNKAHRVAILEQGAQWVETSMSMRDMQFAEINNAQRDKILEAWGFPKFALGMVDDVNRANAEASTAFFEQWLVETRCDDLKDMLNFQVLPLFGQDQNRRYEFDYVSPVPENAEQELASITARSTAAVAMAGAGFDVPATEEWLDLPAISFERPVPPAPILPPGAALGDEPGQGGGATSGDDTAPPTPARKKTAPAPDDVAGNRLPDLAMRWVVEAHLDDSVCEPCRDNNEKTYRNRAAAYEDYPGGKGYVKCVGAEFGNECRCVVKKRRKS